MRGAEKAKQARAAQTAKASSDFYGAVGWVAGLLLTLVVSAPVIWLLVQKRLQRRARRRPDDGRGGRLVAEPALAGRARLHPEQPAFLALVDGPCLPHLGWRELPRLRRHRLGQRPHHDPQRADHPRIHPLCLCSSFTYNCAPSSWAASGETAPLLLRHPGLVRRQRAASTGRSSTPMCSTRCWWCWGLSSGSCSPSALPSCSSWPSSGSWPVRASRSSARATPNRSHSTITRASRT
ncbi:MAG: hypothetical protein MZV70_18020 [Desulfobacterales bacterium]|nr:hypothetical protein [Desulfobacterales bacterium]